MVYKVKLLINLTHDSTTKRGFDNDNWCTFVKTWNNFVLALKIKISLWVHSQSNEVKSSEHYDNLLAKGYMALGITENIINADYCRVKNPPGFLSSNRGLVLTQNFSHK